VEITRCLVTSKCDDVIKSEYIVSVMGDKPLIQQLLSHEEDWCQLMGYRNPYLDPFEHHITSSVTTGDGSAYVRYPENRHVYDKLFVAKSQGMRCGKLEDLRGSEDAVEYPIFIKPRWGHLSAASKNCFKIKSPEQLRNYSDYDHMMWSDFVDGREGMTDFILHNGRIVYQITYVYSKQQNGFTDVWKYISPDTPAPDNIVNWVQDNVRGHTGFVNVQYRNDKIIEVGLRPARSGAYIIATDNAAIMRNLHNVMDKGFWDDSIMRESHFKPFYAFKCYTQVPILHIWPQSVLDMLLPRLTPMPLYEYYFEPVNNEGMVFFQFMHYDFDAGMRAKRLIEALFVMTQLVVLVLLVAIVVALVYSKVMVAGGLFALLVVLFLSRFLNPMYANYNLYKGYRQLFAGKDGLTTPEEFECRRLAKQMMSFE